MNWKPRPGKVCLFQTDCQKGQVPMPRRHRTLPPKHAIIAMAAIFSLLTALGCSPIRNNEAIPGAENDACERDSECGAGLVCGNDALCHILGDPGTTAFNGSCASNIDCRNGLVCGPSGRCGNTAQSEAEESCLKDESCVEGLVCARDGKCRAPGSDGTKAADEACLASEECRLGLVCGIEETCTQLAEWSGVECEDVAPGSPHILFEVPRAGISKNFFDLPFPNDVRTRGGLIDLSGYPGADAEPAPGDLVSRYVTAVENEGVGFGLNSAAIFRFSSPVKYETLQFGGDTPNFLFIDVTPESESRGRAPRSRFYATGGRSKYICRNWLGIRPSEGSPLTAGHTYAVVFLKGLLSADGTPFEPTDDLSAVMGDVPPNHPALRNGWERYAPLRSWLTEKGIAGGDVVGATVFTTGKPQARLAGVRDAVHQADPPVLGDITRCGEGPSPCAGGDGRICASHDNFIEFHARVNLPNFLQGAPPYQQWGGGAVLHDGLPRLQRLENVCVAISVPIGSPPAGGWPVALFAHDQGGHFRTAVEERLSERLTALGWAVLSYDGVLHGPRYGLDEIPEKEKIIERLNDTYRPAFFRDQALQGTADLFALTRLLENLRIENDTGTVGFSSEKIAFIGHGRGAEYGIPFLAYEPRVQAAVVAGVGGDALDQLRLGSNPINLGATMVLGLVDPDLNGMHPGLQIIQHWLDSRDPANYGSLFRRPPEGVNLKHLFMIYGARDSQAPAVTQNALATALRVPLVGEQVESLTAVPTPDTATVSANVGGRTHAIKQYSAEGTDDGHRTLFEHPKAIDDVNEFMRVLETGDGAPTISP